MTSPSAEYSPAITAAWQAALAAEHQAFYGYGLVAAHLVDTPRADLATQCSTEHEDQITQISEAMTAVSIAPVGPLADYPGLYPIGSAKDAAALAARLDDDCTAARRALFAMLTSSVPMGAAASHPPESLYTETQKQLSASAVRAMRWRRVAGVKPLMAAFPGL